MSTIVANVQPVVLQANNVRPCNPNYHNPTAIYIRDVEAVPIVEEPRRPQEIQLQIIQELPPYEIYKRVCVSLIIMCVIIFIIGYTVNYEINTKK